ncbi:uncharacterized protein LOC123305951 [Chrysoperla carnea]|uniref:uncharacterized protein LOC123305951 n=1 Tax=Chrysoperla carnea TaxID=189513 RepID=UPI001D095619|nr:uncharacterized protein LOC123305951 [Chrysoperla carnea]
MFINQKYMFLALVIISCLKMNNVRSDFGSDLAALIKKQNDEIMKRNMALAMSGDGVFACSSPDGNYVSTTQNGKKTTVGSKGPVAGAFGKGSMAVASDDSGTVVATGN